MLRTSVIKQCSPVTPWRSAPPPPYWRICNGRRPKAAAARFAPIPTSDYFAWDEVGYLSFDDKAADLLYEVVNRRYERKPLIVTTNKPFKEWNEVFPNATCIVTLLDRLIHHADVTGLEGQSYRVRESEIVTAARRKRR